MANAAPVPAPLPYADLVDIPHQEANWDRFHALEGHLAAAFLQACPPRRCARHQRVWPMQLRCAVRRADQQVVACIWVIAGSDLRARPAGTIDPDVVLWRCALPLGAGVAVEAFHAALSVPAPLQVALGGGRQTVRRSLRACLALPGRR